MPDRRLQRLHCSCQATSLRDASSDAAEGDLGLLSRVLRSGLHTSDTDTCPGSEERRRRRPKAQPSRSWNSMDVASTARPTAFDGTLQLRWWH